MAASRIPESVRAAEATALKRLYDAREPRMGHKVFAKQYGIGNTAGAVAHYLANRRPLNLDAATRFAQGLSVTIDQFSPRLAAAAALARKAGSNHMAVVVGGPPSTPVARELEPPSMAWPFERIDLARIRSLKRRDQLRLEDAWLVAAALLELPVAKQAAA